MDTKLLMVKTITVIYLSTKVKDINQDIHKIASEVLVAVKPPERAIREELTYDIPNQLRQCIIRMLDEAKASTFNEDELAQRFKIITGNESALYNGLVSMLLTEVEYDHDKVRARVDSEIWNIKRILDQERAAKVAKEWSMKLAWNPENVSWTTLVEDVRKDFEQFQSLTGTTKSLVDHPAIMSIVNLSKPSSVEDMLTRAKEEWSPAGVLKCGMLGINRMCGEPGGFRRGETLLIGALRHNYKTGLSRDIFITIPLCNVPYMNDPTKKPMNLRFSFEDSAKDDIIQIYKRLKGALDHTHVETKDIDAGEAAKYVYDKLSVNGYYNEVLEIDPGLFSLEDIVNTIEDYEKRGYEIHHLNIDYLAMLTKNGKTDGDSLTNVIQMLFTQLRNVCRRKNIFLSTPHQLGTDAKALQKEGVADFVKKVVGKSFYDACKRIDQEVDMEITINKELSNGVYYLAAARGKHRGVNDTPIVDQYCVYQFDPELGLPYDFWGDDQSMRKIGGDTMANGGGAPLWDVN